MRRHTQLHTGNLPATCEVCQKGFPNATTLRAHMAVHMKAEPYFLALIEIFDEYVLAVKKILEPINVMMS